MNMRPSGVLGRTVLAALLLCTASCSPGGGSNSNETASPPVVDVRTGTVDEVTLTVRVSAPGQWRAANEQSIEAPFASILESLGPRPGDRVTTGETIGVLLSRESQAALRGAELMANTASGAAAREEARRALELARAGIVRVPLVSRVSGVVLRRSAEPGAAIPDGGEVLRIVSQRDLVFEAHVALAENSRIFTGSPATVVMEGGDSVHAIVERRLPNANAADQSVSIWLSASSGTPPGLLDRFGTASIQTGQPRLVLAVPDSAVVADELTGEHRVARVDSSGIAIWTPVRLGAAGTGWHELLSPDLRRGDRLVVSGQRGLPDSTHVRLIQ